MLSLPRALDFLLFWLLLLIRCSGTAVAISQSDIPSEIRLTAGLLHSPPFAFIEYEELGMDMLPGADTASGKPMFRGFTVDLLERLKVFASKDQVDLQVDLHPAPEFYSDAFDMVASDCDSSKARNPCDRFDLIVGKFMVIFLFDTKYYSERTT